jgi:molecular chaperone IbpA
LNGGLGNLVIGFSSAVSAICRQFNLADHVQVKSASFDNGLLKIELVREVPEAMKPRRIPIGGELAGNVQQIEAKAA